MLGRIDRSQQWLSGLTAVLGAVPVVARDPVDPTLEKSGIGGFGAEFASAPPVVHRVVRRVQPLGGTAAGR